LTTPHGPWCIHRALPPRGVEPRLAVLALHGFTGGGRDFEPLIAASHDCAWPAVWLCPDLPGHAGSTAVVRPDGYSLDAIFEGLDQLLASAGVCPHTAASAEVCPHTATSAEVCPHTATSAGVCPPTAASAEVCPHTAASAGVCPPTPASAGVCPPTPASAGVCPPSFPLVVCGYSMGGRLGLNYACARPTLVSGLVTVGASPGIADPEARAARRAHDEQWCALLEARGIEAFCTDWERQPVIATQRQLPARWRRVIQQRRRGQDPVALAAALRATGNGVLLPLHDRLPQMTVPALYLAGADDPAFEGHAATMAALHPHGTALSIAGAAHAAHWHQPAATLAAIRDWWTAVSARNQP
jgi:2-succinyl-6-hydroxy-2,4-cyclohexadiene-1-carboxylate synthase